MALFAYTGPIYVRPQSAVGIRLLDHPNCR